MVGRKQLILCAPCRIWSEQEATYPFHCQFPLVPWCLMRFLFFSSWLQMAFAGGWSSLVLGNVPDCWGPPPPAVTLPPSEGSRPHQKSFWWWHLGPATDILVFSDRPSFRWLKLVSTLCYQPGSHFVQLVSSPGICVMQLAYKILKSLAHKILCSWKLVLSMW